MKEIEIPYIGVKIESLPTILKVLKESKSNSDFISYYKKIGKSPKTASEYLASLRNLKLAKKNALGEIEIISAGYNLIEGNIEDLYSNLLNHCIKNFPDLKKIKQLLKEKHINNLNELILELNRIGFTIKRKQTLSSYYKMFNESNNVASKKTRTSISIYKGEILEYNQFLKLIKKAKSLYDTKKIIITDLYNEINKNHTLPLEIYIKYIDTAQLNQQIHLTEINPKIIKDKNSYITLRNKSFYYIDIF